ncbi:flagellar hook-length control protein FliK [Acidovorax soli]|uniref:Flagellar hook-length control protein FliK n=1 Tax=Acidovorax soli TaxID=592050 RepID=A0A7X0UAQ6_9BURK|nr:flagellar hook-length control protein FliK [Acidovorax soli]MBB6561511.1 flagellar hook-length control protein FliK [Acidovorax soli]
MEQARISTPQGTQSPQAARTRQHTAQKGTTDDAAGAGAAQAGSFLALLAAQDPELIEGDPLAADPGAGDASLLAQNLGDPSALAGFQALAAADSMAAQQWQGLVGQGAVAAGSDGAASGLSTVGWGGAARGALAGLGQDADAAAALNGRLLATDGLVAQTAALDGGAQGAQTPSTATMGFGRQFSRMHAAALQRGGGEAGTGLAGGAGDALAARTGGRVDAKQAASTTTDLSAASPALAALVREVGAGTHRALGDNLGAAGLDAAALAGQDPAAAVAATSARSGADAGGGDSSAQGGAGGLAEAGADTSSTYSVDGTSGAPGFDELAQASMEEQLAEQVTYWANQKSQNAEMTLNRDGQPLAVTVSLSGNEAHVSFRSDQEQTRTLLDQSMAQLSDLLRGEGLVLSGMTVGTSGGQGAAAGDGGQQRDGRAGEGQQATVKVAGPADVSQRLAGSSTRSSGVDVFV